MSFRNDLGGRQKIQFQQNLPVGWCTGQMSQIKYSQFRLHNSPHPSAVNFHHLKHRDADDANFLKFIIRSSWLTMAGVFDPLKAILVPVEDSAL